MRSHKIKINQLVRGLVPKPFGFRQRTVLRAEEAGQARSCNVLVT